MRNTYRFGVPATVTTTLCGRVSDRCADGMNVGDAVRLQALPETDEAGEAMTFLYAFTASMLGHFVGDYVFQNQWMAINKSKPGWPGHLACTVHVLLYTTAVALFVGWHPLFLLAVAAPTGSSTAGRWRPTGCG